MTTIGFLRARSYFGWLSVDEEFKEAICVVSNQGWLNAWRSMRFSQQAHEAGKWQWLQRTGTTSKQFNAIVMSSWLKVLISSGSAEKFFL
jgi:hypothetical protein